MELHKGVHFLKVPKTGIIDSSNILVVRDATGLACMDIGGGGESNIRQTLRLFESEGLKISDLHTVLISHTHADHMGAIGHFRDLVPGVTVVDHEADAPFLRDNRLLNEIFDAELVARHFPGTRFDILEFYRNFCPISETSPDRTVVEGELFEWGEFVFEVIHTPGHHPGHLSLFERTHRDLFVGDMLGTEVPFYTPRSGGVEGYLASLDKYRALQAARIVPSHGDLIEEPERAIEEAMGKVMQRHERVCEALKAGPRTVRELVPEVVRRPSQHAFPGVAIVVSHLAALAKEGVVQEVEGGRVALTGRQ